MNDELRIVWHEHRPNLRIEHLLLRPIVIDDLPAYERLFKEGATIQQYLRGKTPREDDVQRLFSKWLKRWELDAFSALAVVDVIRQEVIGHAMLGHGDYVDKDRGWADLTVVMDLPYFVSGMIDEVVNAMVALGFALKARGCRVPVDVSEGGKINAPMVHLTGGKIDWAYVPFTEIRVTTSPENIVARTIGQALQKKWQATKLSYANRRDYYIVPLDGIEKKD